MRGNCATLQHLPWHDGCCPNVRAVATLSNSHVTGKTGGNSGGGIVNDGTLTVANTMVKHNSPTTASAAEGATGGPGPVRRTRFSRLAHVAPGSRGFGAGRREIPRGESVRVVPITSGRRSSTGDSTKRRTSLGARPSRQTYRASVSRQKETHHDTAIATDPPASHHSSARS